MSDHRDNVAPHGPDRRDFLQTAGLVGAALARSQSLLLAEVPPQLKLSNTGPDLIPRKPFGRTAETVSVIGLGGYSLGDAPSLQEAIAIAHEAVDAGVNFFDNAWEYHDGRSEEWMGHALKGRRDKVFLMTKVCTHGRDKQVAMRQLDESLKALRHVRPRTRSGGLVGQTSAPPETSAKIPQDGGGFAARAELASAPPLGPVILLLPSRLL